MARETAREVEADVRKLDAESLLPDIPHGNGCRRYHLACALRWALDALTAERERAERAERERDLAEQSAQVTREQWLEAFRRLAADRVPVASTHLLTMLDDVLTERDTLLARVAVLQAECQAGRARFARHDATTTDTYYAARLATDVAGAMGEE